MIDHEPFLVLGTRVLHEPLTAEETDRLERHLATCPSCRAHLAAMRADDARIRALLAAEPVPQRVHDRVLEAARGGRHVGRAFVLAAAAILVLVAVAGTAVGGRFWLASSPSPSLLPVPSVLPSPSPSPTPSPTPIPSPSQPILGSVNGAYAYSVKPGATRRDSVAATLAPGPSGEWSRMVPADGSGSSAGGTLTCLVIDGSEAWMAGPAATASDGSTDRAAFLYVRDGGPGGADDMVVLWMNDPGQTLATMEGWCTSRFIPAGPYPVEDGDVTVVDGTS